MSRLKEGTCWTYEREERKKKRGMEIRSLDEREVGRNIRRK